MEVYVNDVVLTTTSYIQGNTIFETKHGITLKILHTTLY